MNALLLVLTLGLIPPQEIDDLIRTLGSEKAEEREAAERKLVDLGEPARPSLKKAAEAGDTEIGRRSQAVLALLDRYAFLDQLVARAREFGMPFPPPEAPFKKFEAGRWRRINGKDTPDYTLGFLLKKTTGKEPGLMLRGPEEQYASDDREGWMVDVKPLKGTEQNLCAETQDQTFRMNSLILTALQCKTRGWNEFAETLLLEGCRHSAGDRFSCFQQPAGLSPKTAFAFMAWSWFGNALTRGDSDRAAIARHMKSLFAEEPKLDSPVNRSLLKALDAALEPSKAEAGSVEALIDDLTNASSRGSRRRREELDPRVRKIVLLGFDAVPALIARLDDERLTRSVTEGFNNFPTYIRRLNEVISDLLQGLAGDELGKDWLRRQQGYPVEKSAAEAWWKEARKTGERDYFLKQALGGGTSKQWPEFLILEILGRKYPDDLAGIYRDLLEKRPEMQSWPVANLIGSSALPREKKIELFSLAGRHANLEHRRAAFWELKSIDAPLFVSLLVETLDGLPSTPKEPYWSCREGSFAKLAMETDDPKAREALEKAARRADPGLRMQMIQMMSYAGRDELHVKQRLRFLANFLDDAAVRDVTINPRMYEGPYAGGEYKKIEVRNFAASLMTYLLEMKAEPDNSWTEEQWAALRTRVKEAFDRSEK